ncbi:MAG: DUF2155 domain-containing protein [Rhodobacteraceae bacterium]|nr:DUF2155 domain-containing protein [Paracoccaceae bacterium]
MRSAAWACLSLILSAPLSAQSITVESLDPTEPSVTIIDPEAEVFSLSPLQELGTVTSEEVTPVVKGTGAKLRGLDTLNGKAVDFDLDNGYSVVFGDLRVDLAECRHPEDNPTGEAFAFLTIYGDEEATEAPLFQGWMIASSPALSALDHPRYDVWVLRCKTPAAESGATE